LLSFAVLRPRWCVAAASDGAPSVAPAALQSATSTGARKSSSPPRSIPAVSDMPWVSRADPV